MRALICRLRRGHVRNYPPTFGWGQPNPCRVCGRTVPGTVWVPDEATVRTVARADPEAAS